MSTLDHPASGFQKYFISDASTRVAQIQPNSGATPEKSDRYTDWALRFEQSLKKVEDRIRDWSRDPSALTEEGLEAPSTDAITSALSVIRALETMAMDRVPSNYSVLLDLIGASVGSDGEISLELASGPFAMTYRIQVDGNVSRLFFRDNRLVRRI